MRTRSFPTVSSIATLALLVACVLPSAAAVKVAAVPSVQSDAARTRLRLMIDDAKAEVTLAASTRSGLVQSASDAQAQLATSSAKAIAAQAASARLNAVAKDLRRQAYAISDMPGLSAEQNHKSVAAMEAADAAETDARVAQFAVATTAATTAHDRVTLDTLSMQLTVLDARIDACNRLLKLNGAALSDDKASQR